MKDFSTELVKNLYFDKERFNEIMREMLEEAINGILQSELGAFLGYETYSYAGRNSGDSRNGSYERIIQSQFGPLHLTIPRDRNGEFSQKLIPGYSRRTDSLEDTIIHLYSHGVTTGEIADIIEHMYGSHYSRSTVSNITMSVTGLVEAFHTKAIKEKYAVVYCDATYLNLRRDTVSPEALHVILGITPDGKKEVLDYAVYPSESAQNYREMLERLKERGLKQILLFVSDGLNGLHRAIKMVYPDSKYQSCWVHLSRNVRRLVRKKDWSDVLGALKTVYTQENANDAKEMLEAFLDMFADQYPKLRGLLADVGNLFTFYEFPTSIRRSIYSTNLMERCNKYLKSGYRKKEQFPHEESLDRYVATFLTDYNNRYSELAHRGFLEAEPELLAMFKE